DAGADRDQRARCVQAEGNDPLRLAEAARAESRGLSSATRLFVRGPPVGVAPFRDADSARPENAVPCKGIECCTAVVCSRSLGARLVAEGRSAFTSVAVREPFHACVGARCHYASVTSCLQAGLRERTSGLRWSGYGGSACSSDSFRSPDLQVG